MKTRRLQRNKTSQLSNRQTNESNDNQKSPSKEKFKMEVEPKFESENANSGDTECGAGDNTESVDASISNSNTVLMLNESKCEEPEASEQKEVIDISNGYVELTSLYDQNQSTPLNGTDCVYSGFQMIPSSNCSGEESTVLAYAWNQQISTVSSDTTNSTSLSYVTSNAYPQLQTTNANSYISSSSIAWPRRAYYATLSNAQHLSGNPTALILASNRSVGNDDNATALYRKNDRQFVTLGDVLKERQYTPSHASRQSHNEKERRRRSRMKHSCEMLRSLVPGVSEKTDKATVLEHTVKYLMHLQRCVSVKCNDYIPEVLPSTATPKLQFITTPFRYDASMQIPSESQLEEHQYFSAQESRLEREDEKENEQHTTDASSN